MGSRDNEWVGHFTHFGNRPVYRLGYLVGRVTRQILTESIRIQPAP